MPWIVEKIICLFLVLYLTLSLQTPESTLDQELSQLLEQRNLKGIQIEITANDKAIYDNSFGLKNDQNEKIDSNTVFRVASLSKSLSSVALLQLVEQSKLSLTDDISHLLGSEVKNPFFPQDSITVEMLLSHQSSIIECEPYYSNFLMDSYNAKNGYQVPPLKEILTPEGKYYNQCLFSSSKKPGTYFQYVNLNFGIAGTIVEKVSGLRFDIYQKQFILDNLSVGEAENATFNPATISNYKNLGTVFVGKEGKWVANIDNYSSRIPQRNLTGYTVGSNGLVYGPQGGMRASVHHLNNYMIMLKNNGLSKNGKRILSQESVNELLKPRYQFHGTISGPKKDFNLYGLGLYTTSYHRTDTVIEHEVVKGHLGVAYGLISGYFFWKNYTFSYIVNGALNGYQYGTGTIYEGERLKIHSAVQQFIESRSQNYVGAE